MIAPNTRSPATRPATPDAGSHRRRPNSGGVHDHEMPGRFDHTRPPRRHQVPRPGRPPAMLLLDPAGNPGPASTACSNTTCGLSTMSGVRPVAPPIGCGLIHLQVNVIGSRAGGAAVACLERWLDGVQAQHRDVGAFHGWKPGRSKRRAELCAGKARAQQLLGLPDTAGGKQQPSGPPAGHPAVSEPMFTLAVRCANRLAHTSEPSPPPRCLG